MVDVAAAPDIWVAPAVLTGVDCLMKPAAASARMPTTSKATKEVVMILIVGDSFIMGCIGSDGDYIRS
jgi:hypothetical protein